MKKLQINKKQ